MRGTTAASMFCLGVDFFPTSLCSLAAQEEPQQGKQVKGARGHHRQKRGVKSIKYPVAVQKRQR